MQVIAYNCYTVKFVQWSVNRHEHDFETQKKLFWNKEDTKRNTEGNLQLIHPKDSELPENKQESLKFDSLSFLHSSKEIMSVKVGVFLVLFNWFISEICLQEISSRKKNKQLPSCRSLMGDSCTVS